MFKDSLGYLRLSQKFNTHTNTVFFLCVTCDMGVYAYMHVLHIHVKVRG